LDTYPEEREVEIFELQHRAVGTSESGWESFLFSLLALPSPATRGTHILKESTATGSVPRDARW
jgi:hypothetical protein